MRSTNGDHQTSNGQSYSSMWVHNRTIFACTQPATHLYSHTKLNFYILKEYFCRIYFSDMSKDILYFKALLNVIKSYIFGRCLAYIGEKCIVIIMFICFIIEYDTILNIYQLSMSQHLCTVHVFGWCTYFVSRWIHLFGIRMPVLPPCKRLRIIPCWLPMTGCADSCIKYRI